MESGKSTQRRLNNEDLNKVSGGYVPCATTIKIPCRDSEVVDTWKKFCWEPIWLD